MRQIIRRTVSVQPGGSIVVHDAGLPAGAEAEVIVIVREPGATIGFSVALDLLDTLPGNRLFKTSLEADKYLQAERDSWDH